MGLAAPRSAWTSRKVNLVPGPEMVKVVFTHHTAYPGPPAVSVDEERQRMLNIESTHINDRGWAAIGYSKVVFPSGRAYDGRGWGFKQGGNYDGGTNESTYSICFDGDFTTKSPTDEAWATAAALITEGLDQDWIDPEHTLKGHREEVIPPGVPGKEHCAGLTVVDCTGKDCPGKGVYEHFDRLEDDMALTEEQVEALAFLSEIKKGFDKKVAGGANPPKDKEPDRYLGWRLAKIAGL